MLKQHNLEERVTELERQVGVSYTYDDFLAQGEFAKLSTKNEELRAENKANDRSYTRLCDDYKALSTKYDELRAQNQTLKDHADTLRNMNTQQMTFFARTVNAEAQNEVLKARVEELSSDYIAANTKNEKLLEDSDAVWNQLQVAETARLQHLNRAEALSTENEVLREKVQTAIAELENLNECFPSYTAIACRTVRITAALRK